MFDSGSVHSVFITSFSDTATFHSSGSNGGWFTDLTQAYAAINAIQANGSTNYDAALNTVTANFVAPPSGGNQLVSVFISDGQPNAPAGSAGIVGAEETNWYGFLQTNHFSNSYAVGFSGLTTTDKGFLEPIAWRPSETASTYAGATDPNVVVVAQASDVANALLTLVAVTNTLTGNLHIENTPGADAPMSLVSVNVVGGAVNVFGAGNTSFTLNTDAGTLVVKSNGDYTFTAASSVAADKLVAINYTVADADGDKATYTLNLKVLDGVPTAVADVANATEGHWVATANVTDTITYVVPGHWGSASTANVSTGNSSELNPGKGGVPVSASTANYAVVADATHTATIRVGLELNGFNASQDRLSVALVDAAGHQVGAAQNLTATGQLTFAGIAASGSYHIVATGSEGSSGSGNFKFKFDTVDLTTYGYTPDTTATRSVNTHDLNWATGPVSMGNVLANDLAGGNVGLHLTAVVAAGSSSLAVSTVAGVDVIGAYGTLHIGSTGAYTYTPGSGDFKPGVTDKFSYTLVDANGHASTADLTVALNNYAYSNTVGANLYAGTDGNDILAGTGGHQAIYGGWGDDTLTGVGNDRLVGGAGNDHLTAGPGDANVLIGGAGSDVMTGSAAGADVFKWALADQGSVGSPAVDHITNFNTSTIPNGGDVLDLRDLLQGESSATGNLDQFLHFDVVGGKLALEVHATGDANSTQTIVLDNIAGNVNTAMVQLAHAVDSAFTGTSISDAELLKKLVDTGHLKTD
jgi:surface adhesion protein